MKPGSLDYASVHRLPPRRSRRVRVLGAVVICAAIVSSPFVTILRTETRMDAVTGSMTRRTVWVFGLTSGTIVEASPLALRLNKIGVKWNPNWCLLSDTGRNVFGNPTDRACGTAPPIFRLRPGLDSFVAASTDGELRAFIAVMQSGTDAQQYAAIDAAAEKGLRGRAG